jgi:uncharacterized protein YkwD
MEMNLIDVVLSIIILLSVYSGYKKGFVIGTADLLLLALGLLFAFWAYGYVAGFIENRTTWFGVWTRPLAFIFSYFFGRVLLGVLARLLLQRMPPRVHDSRMNKTFGIFPGVINGLIYSAIVSALLLAMPMFDGLSTKTRNSSIANALTPHVEWADEKFAPVFDEAVNHSLNKLTIRPESKKTVDLHYTVTNPRVREDLESRMLEMVNEERQKEGLSPLKADPEMREVAIAHSKDMFAKGYFSHVNKEGKTPAQRAREAGVRFLIAGENLALAPTLKIAHEGLMNSPGHRANILNRSYGRVGIGILDGGRYGLMVTQNFRN